MKIVVQPLTDAERAEWRRDMRAMSDRSLATTERETVWLLVAACEERLRRKRRRR